MSALKSREAILIRPWSVIAGLITDARNIHLISGRKLIWRISLAGDPLKIASLGVSATVKTEDLGEVADSAFPHNGRQSGTTTQPEGTVLGFPHSWRIRTIMLVSHRSPRDCPPSK